METLSELLEEQVKDLYSAENQLLKALPKMAKKATTPELRDGFLKHAQETGVHVDRIAKVAQLLGFKPTGKVCAAMKGLVEEGKEVIEEEEKSLATDGALIAAAQRVEHYEIAAYGTVSVLAKLLGKNDAAKLFDQTLAEEKATDAKLTMVAEQKVYPNASKEEGEGGEEEQSGSGGSSGGKRKPPSRAQAAKGGKNSRGKSKSR